MFNAGSPSQGFGSSNQMYTQQCENIDMFKCVFLLSSSYIVNKFHIFLIVVSRNYNGNTAAFQRSTPTNMLQPQSPNRSVSALQCSVI